MSNHHENVVLNRTYWKKEQRAREVFNISNYSQQRTSVQRLVDLLGKEEHWTPYSLNPVMVEGGVFEHSEVLVCRDGDLNFHLQLAWRPATEA